MHCGSDFLCSANADNIGDLKDSVVASEKISKTNRISTHPLFDIRCSHHPAFGQCSPPALVFEQCLIGLVPTLLLLLEEPPPFVSGDRGGWEAVLGQLPLSSRSEPSGHSVDDGDGDSVVVVAP